MAIVSIPHLPAKKVTSVLCGKNKTIECIMKNRGVAVHNLTSDRRLPLPIVDHTDIQCCHIDKGIILTTNSNLTDITEEYEVKLIDEIPGDNYPNDCLLNCFVTNGVLITGKKCSKSVIEYAEKNNIEIRFINQGYAKCSTALVSNDAIITADKSIASALDNYCKVLVINPGYIKLEGYNYGFIGGACGKLSSDELAFMGNPYKHYDGRRIVSFTEDNNCEAVSLCNGDLIDFGGFIPLYEAE